MKALFALALVLVAAPVAAQQKDDASVKPAKCSAFDVAAEPLAGRQYLFARSARLGPLCASQRGNEAQSGPSDNYDVLYARYLNTARSLPVTTTAPDTSWMTGLFPDLRARRVNDLVTVSVTESVAAVGSADSNLDKSSSGAASLTKLFGLESKYPGWLDPTSLAATASNTSFSGGGSTTRTGELSATLTARVVEVLPNGDLALEGVREVDINGDVQILVLTGVVRTADIGPGNVVPSTAIGQMRIRYFGRGLIRDNLKPGWIIRVLNKIF